MPLVQVEVDGQLRLIDRSLLTVRDLVEEGDNFRSIATEWYLNDTLVRRDAHVMVLRTEVIGSQQAALS